jgi:hypothetical protein
MLWQKPRKGLAAFHVELAVDGKVAAALKCRKTLVQILVDTAAACRLIWLASKGSLLACATTKVTGFDVVAPKKFVQRRTSGTRQAHHENRRFFTELCERN